MNKALFPGSFDPFTRGHADIALRALAIADCLVIGVGFNESKPGASQSALRRVDIIKDWARRAGLDNRIDVMAISGLTADCARQIGAGCIVRGVRDSSDFLYEYNMACVNRQISGVETILLPADPALSTLSSSVVRELEHFGRDVSDFLP